MSAIITENFRRNNTTSFIADTASNYYVGLGKSDKWTSDEEADPTVPDPYGTYADEYEIKNNLITLIGVNSTSMGKVIPNIKFTSNSRYKEYQPLSDSCFYATTVGSVIYSPCYATVGGYIYLCLRSGTSYASIVPQYNSSNVYAPFTNNDGYTWVLIDIIDTNLTTNTVTDQFISITPNICAAGLINAIGIGSGGLLYGFDIISGGLGYTANPTQAATFVYTNTNVSPVSYTVSLSVNVKTNVNTGAITSITLNSSPIAPSLVLTGSLILTSITGIGLICAPRIAPAKGFAYAPYKVLPAWYAAVTVKAESSITGDGFYIPYRQISILKGLSYKLGTVNPVTSLGALPYLALANAPTITPTVGDLLTVVGSDSYISTIFYDIYVESATEPLHRLYYHQNNVSGYAPISSSSSAINKDGTSIGTTHSAKVTAEYIANTGDVVFIENRKAITRAESQTEEIKIIIQF